MTQRLDDSEGARPRASAPSIEPASDRRQISPTRSLGRSAVGLTLVAGLALALLAWFWPQPARAAGSQATSGEQLYAQHCASCHQAAGQGIEGTFPPLAGNPAAADVAYVDSVIRAGLSGPIEVLGVSYDAVMPPAAALTDPGEIQQVAQYVAGLAGGTGTGTGSGPDDDAEPADTGDGQGDTETPGEVAGPIVGDVDRGHDLFVGAARLDNGGPACAACHTAGSVGNMGGWSLGPDLTATFDTLGGEAGLSGWLANPPSPVMQPLFANRPMSESEIADVVAFLGDAPDQNRPASSYDRLTVAAIGGLVSLIAGMTLAWRGMRRTYVDKLRSRPGGRPRGGRPGRTRAGAGVGVPGGPRSTPSPSTTPGPHPQHAQDTAPAGGRNR